MKHAFTAFSNDHPVYFALFFISIAIVAVSLGAALTNHLENSRERHEKESAE